jgi:hypothetical protein
MDELMDQLSGDDEEKNGKWGWLGGAIPITLALMATLMAISKVVDDNLVQDIIAKNQDKASQWGLYDETSIKEKLYQTAREQMEVQLITSRTIADAAALAALRKKIEEFREQEEYYGAEKDHIRSGKENKTKVAALKKKKKSDGEDMSIEEIDRRLKMENQQDDWFDRSDAAFSIALAFLALCALMKNKRLYFASVGLGVIATAMMTYGYFLPNMLPK